MDPHDKPSVLVVDDDEKNLLAYAGMLEGLDIRLCLAHSAREAFQHLLRQQFAVIVMDVNMPGMDGFEAAALIRQREKCQHTPLIFATASYKEDLQIFKGYSLGAVDYLVKPLVPEILRSKVAVFVDLFRKTQQIVWQTQELRAAERREHQERLEREQQRWQAERLERELETERRHLETVRQLNQELERRLLQLDHANCELAQRNQENEVFVYSVSHDLRSPLVNLQGFSHELEVLCGEVREILAQRDSTDAARTHGLALCDEGISESIRFIQAAVTRLSVIINALLRLSRAGRVEYVWQEVDVRAVAARVIDSMRSIIDERQAKVMLEDLPPAWGDPTAIERLFANLIGNAVNYLDPARPGEVVVGSSENAGSDQGPGAAGAQVVYFVRDNGLGIAAAHQPQIFQVFKRLQPDAAPGEGLGLAIVQRIVQRHGGKIWLESEVGQGTTFYVALPAEHTQSASAQDGAMERPTESRIIAPGRLETVDLGLAPANCSQA